MLIVFDMGNVVSLEVDIMPALVDRLGIGEQELRESCGDHFYGLTTGAIRPEEFWRRFAKEFALEADEDFLATLFSPVIDTEVANLCRRLRSQGHRVVCGTNTIEQHYRFHAGRQDYDCFDVVYASHLMGCAKPEAAFYRAILQQEQSHLNGDGRPLFIDDMGANTAAAEREGFAAHRYTGHSGLYSFLRERGIGDL